MALVSILKGGAFLIGLGVVTAGTINMVKSNAQPSLTCKIRLPRILDGFEAIRDSLLTMSEHPRANLPQLERVGRRCASLVEAYVKISSARGDTVKASIITLGSKYMASIKFHLNQFYLDSDILLVKVGDKSDKTMEPLNIDLKIAHEALLQSVDCLAETIQITAREKIEEGVAERV